MKKSIVAIAMCLVLALGMMVTGCGGRDSLPGKWVTEIDLGKTFQESLGEMGIEKELGTYNVKFFATFTDSTIKFEIDKESFRAVAEDFIKDVKPVVKELLESFMSLADVTDVDAYARQEGYDNFDALYDDMMKVEDLEESMGDAGFEESYTLDGDKIVMGDEYIVYSLEGGKLIFKESSETDDSILALLPITFEAA